MLNTEFSPWPCYTEEEIEAVSRVLRSNRVNYWTGQECSAFEDEFSRWVGTKHAVTVANGTLALEAALRSLGIGPGDEVIVPSRTFFASASAVVAVGARPVFADVDRNSQNITVQTIQAAFSTHTRAVICVHLAGWPCDMASIGEFCRAHDLFIVEDCAQAHGAVYQGKMIGSLGDVAAWSFCQDKIMTTGGEGGMVTTNDESIWSKVWSLKDHGKSWATVHSAQHPPGFRWLHDSFGSNWRMTEMQAAIGRIQLGYIDDWSSRRRAYAKLIWDEASDVGGIRVPTLPADVRHAAYKCYVFLDQDSLGSGWSRDRVMAEIQELGVPCYSGSCSEVYREKAFDRTGWRPARPFPVARELGETSLMFLVHPTLSIAEIEKTVAALRKVMSRAVR